MCFVVGVWYNFGSYCVLLVNLVVDGIMVCDYFSVLVEV